MTTASFETQLTKTIPPLERYARRLTGGAERAEDLVQDTMIEALRNKEKLASCTYPERYMAVIMRNLNISSHRKFAPEQASQCPEELALPAQDAPACARAVCREVVEALRTLSHEHSEVLILSAYEGLSYKELAQRLDIPQGTVMSRLHRARAALRERVNLRAEERVCDIFSETS